jgi:hypothetical protein
VTPDCVQALIGPLKPPPYHRYAAPGFEDFDEILREWLLNATDRVFPRLWQFLLLGNRVVPDWALLLHATVTLPMHAAKILVPTILFRRGTPARLADVWPWALCYQVVGLSSVWIEASEIITRFLQWSYDGPQIMEIPRSIVPALALYDAVIAIGGTALPFTHTSTKAAADVERSTELMPPEKATPLAKSTWSASSVVLGWWALDLTRLVPLALVAGWQVLPLAIIRTTLRFFFQSQMARLMKMIKPSHRRILLYLGLSALTEICLDRSDQFLTRRRVLTPATIDFLWTRQFYLGKVRLDYRNSFLSEIDAVLQGMGSECVNGSYFRRIREDPVVGINILPEPWARLREFLRREASAEHEDYAWLREEL